MVAVTSETAAPAAQGPDLRWKIGAGLAVAWMLSQLWFLSPLEYLLEEEFNLGIFWNDSEARGLQLGFTLALAFLFFPPRFLSVRTLDTVLAVAGLVSGSILFWNYENVAGPPGSQSTLAFVIACIGLFCLILASLRVLGVVISGCMALLIFPFFLFLDFENLSAGIHEGVGELLQLAVFQHWYSAESVFGIVLGMTTSFVFFFVVVGAGLDRLGLGRQAVRLALWAFRNSDSVVTLPVVERFAERMGALIFLVGFVIYQQNFEAKALLSWESHRIAVLVGLGGYAAFAAIVWGLQYAPGTALWPRARSLAVTGLLTCFGILAGSLLFWAFALLAQGIAEIVFRPLRSGVQFDWLIFFIVGTLPLTILALRLHDPAKRKFVLAILAFLPVLLLFWEWFAERYSPGLSAFWGASLLFVVMAQTCWIETKGRGLSFGNRARMLASDYFLPLCNETARVMVRVVLLAAGYGMFIFWVGILRS